MMSSSSSPKLEDLGFLSGAWTAQVWGDTFEETWLSPADGAMVGVGRHRANGKTGFVEFMSIETAPSGEVTLYVAQGRLSQGASKPDPFRMESADGRTATFVRGGDDFPQRIRYASVATGLACTISGTQRGKPAEERFDFRAIPHAESR